MAMASSTSDPGTVEPLDHEQLMTALAAAEVPWNDITFLEVTGSTNSDLVSKATAGEAATGSVIIADSQTAGRGRLGREWESEPGTTLSFSVMLAAPAPATQLLPLVVGLAVVRAASPGEQATIELKWPNDLLVDGKKAAGILAEAVPGGAVVGCGINVSTPVERLPVPEATSLALHGIEVERTTLLAQVLIETFAGYDRLVEAGYNPEASGLLAEFRRRCGTLGREVRVQLPDQTSVTGRATDVDDQGRLVLEGPDGQQILSVGDVTHLRH
ncbi:MAG: biotin--[acetyl-CoA-carboxylase] ligase [Micrococcales bacterium]|nr:biotin--[acetyl-CoA-carboxylase] ligase [Micrococcales bacterium]